MKAKNIHANALKFKYIGKEFIYVTLVNIPSL